MYKVFKRTWWKINRNGLWPNNLEPCPGVKHYIERFDREEDARSFCQERNKTKEVTSPDNVLSLKYEYTR